MYVRLHFLCFIVYQVHVQSQQEVADIVTMDPLWIEFRSSPSVYLSSRKMDVDAFVNDVLQVSTTIELHLCVTFSLSLDKFNSMSEYGSFSECPFPWYYAILDVKH